MVSECGLNSWDKMTARLIVGGSARSINRWMDEVYVMDGRDKNNSADGQ